MTNLELLQWVAGRVREIGDDVRDIKYRLIVLEKKGVDYEFMEEDLICLEGLDDLGDELEIALGCFNEEG